MVGCIILDGLKKNKEFRGQGVVFSAWEGIAWLYWL